MKERKPRQRPLRKKLLRNRYLVSLRYNETGKVKSLRCCQFNILPTAFAVTFKHGEDPSRRFTEWFNREKWTLVTPEERQAHYIKKETARVQMEREKLAKRLAKRDPDKAEEKRRVMLEKKRRYMKEYLAKKKAETAAVATPPEEQKKPLIVFEEAPVVPEPTSPDVLTPAEAATFTDTPQKAVGAGDVNKEMPNEYNAQYHLKHDKHPFGDPEKLVVFDAMVSAEATMREAKIRIEQARARRTIAEKIEREGAGWTSG